MYQDFESELNWAMRHMPRTRAAVAALPDLSGVRLACNMHLDLKMAPLVSGLLDKGAAIYLTTCNPTTVQDDVVAWLERRGAEAYAWRDMSDAEWSASFDRALAWAPTHLCEMGADLTTRLHQSNAGPQIIAGLEATGSGISRLNGMAPRYPIFNWDDLPVKEGLHNRHMVGLTAWHTFFQTTHLTLHEKCVLVIGYGLVGQGVAAAAKAYGGQVIVAEIDPARALQARYDGWAVLDLASAVSQADVIATATGAKNVLSARHLQQAKDGVFILNVGHVTAEIDVGFLQNLPHSEPMPFVNAYQLEEKTLYLLANGSMFNLTAGYGDSLNAFDVTLAVMAAGIGHIVGDGARQQPGLYLLPQSAWQPAL
ncbi:adenosylhomocysteinase [Serratia proteamaculans]|uniref:adenosylhomocysteinase n=1 Tax=Serratia proteamaculans TaxID=28151 RepID=UPI00157600F6|nr:adenosylhomocysteinase [Serratia proteamaculans]NTX77696.1 adenosylhomocysteinase [Serratia proteamaculans]NTZ28061.1 adenosylhomocysteinase [Serratia proteamaculans]